MSIQESLLEPQNIQDDLDRHLLDGNIEYIRRNDVEVTIRGHNVKLNSLENTLLNYPHIKQVCVLAKDSAKNRTDNRSKGSPAADNYATKFLVVYYVSDQEIDADKFTAYLSLCLPEYMVPNYLVWMAALPLTAYGQVDRHALQLF
ncbi:MAG: acyl-CoA synthetase (AMP-forming)/AMP-acid ligase II [Moritella sp.]|jgi:acyl-CoA synthetase (AMP-forming)/AMP-acid ligase II